MSFFILNTTTLTTFAGQFRHAQQVPEFNERMSAPGVAGTTTSASAQKTAKDFYANEPSASRSADRIAAAAESVAAQSPAEPVAHPVRDVVSAVMTTLHVSRIPRQVRQQGLIVVVAQPGQSPGAQTGPGKPYQSTGYAEALERPRGDVHEGQYVSGERKNDPPDACRQNSDYKDGYRRD